MTVGELLGGKRQFSIPSYQRDYSWTSKEADQLIDDLLLARQEIESAPQAPKALYLSLMIIMDDTTPRRAISRLRRGTGVPSEVIDGKQRLTTLTMLIALLRDLLGDEGAWLQHYLVETGRSRLWPREAPRLLLEEHEQEFLTAHVLPRGANLAPSPRDIAHQSVKRMRSVRDHLRTRLRKLERPLLVNLAELLIERCAVTAIVPNDITAGFRMFVTANFRGKALSTSDIVKAELVGSLEPQERRKASDAWGELRNRLEPPPDNPVEAKNAASFDNLLSYVHKLRCKPGSTIFQGIEDLAGTAPSPLADEVRSLVEARLGRRPSGPIRLLTHLRSWGYVQNPVSFYYCFDTTGRRVESVVAEVTNTPWGDRHCYAVGGTDGPAGGTLRARFPKASSSVLILSKMPAMALPSELNAGAI